MARSYNYYVYIVASASRTLYVGVTNDLERRVWQHRNKAIGGFTAKYDVSRLVWFEHFHQVEDAIAAEKRINGWGKEGCLDRGRKPKVVGLAPGLGDLSPPRQSMSTACGGGCLAPLDMTV